MGALCRVRRRPGGRRLSDGRRFALEDDSRPVGELVEARPPPVGRSRTAVVCRPPGTAVVLGSTEPSSHLDVDGLARRSYDGCRRRSGGGAVLVAPGAQVWLDVFVGRDDALFLDDVRKSFLWLGELWAAAVREVAGARAVRVATAVAPGDRWSAWMCFAGTGCGEVTLGGRKVVGLSQRRDREGAWFHSMALVTDRVDDLVSCLALGAERDEAARVLRDRSAPLSCTEETLTEALLRLLS